MNNLKVAKNASEPIKNRIDIEKIKEYLGKKSKRNQLIFIMGINLPLKSQDILGLTIEDLINEDNEVRKLLKIENKEYEINSAIRDYLEIFLKSEKRRTGVLFESIKTKKAINRSHLYKILNDAKEQCNLDIHIGNESLRKTFGYHYYLKTRDIKKLKELFNKHSCKELLEYLSIKEEKEEFFL